MLKEQLRYVGRAVDDGGTLQKRACRTTSLVELHQLLERELLPLPAERLDLGAWGGALERSGDGRADREASHLAGQGAQSAPAA
jgi:hypothetical protein